MSASRDSGGRDLTVGDPVTLSYGGIANRGHVGVRSRGTVTGFGSVNVQVRISESMYEELIGTTVPVPGSHLKYGHVGHVRAADALTEISRKYNADIERGKAERAEEVLGEVIRLALERGIITPEQGRALWVLQNDIPPQDS